MTPCLTCLTLTTMWHTVQVNRYRWLVPIASGLRVQQNVKRSERNCHHSCESTSYTACWTLSPDQVKSHGASQIVIVKGGGCDYNICNTMISMQSSQCTMLTYRIVYHRRLSSHNRIHRGNSSQLIIPVSSYYYWVSRIHSDLSFCSRVTKGTLTLT